MPTHIIYIPGLGDRYDPFRRACLKLWRVWGVTTEHIPIVWYDGGDFEEKYAKIKRSIDAVGDRRVVIIGESAGATLALQVAANEPDIHRVITLCGVARPETPIATYLRRRAPALHHGVNTLKTSFDIDVHSVRAFADNVVGRPYSVVKGSTEHVIWSIGHFTTIALCLTLYSFALAGIAKK